MIDFLLGTAGLQEVVMPVQFGVEGRVSADSAN